MKKIFLIRHAESESNAGNISEHNKLVRLTEKGKQQAKDLLEILDKPDRVIVSKFVRTQETAEPLLGKFNDVESHLWLDTHEFDYLDKKLYIGKPYEEYENYAKEYWQQCDPEIRYADHLETFKEFTNRVHGVIVKMSKLDGKNYIFTHGHFIALFGHLTRYFTCSTFEKESQMPNFYHDLMKNLNDSYHRDDYLQAKNTEVIDVTEMVEKYTQNMI